LNRNFLLILNLQDTIASMERHFVIDPIKGVEKSLRNDYDSRMNTCSLKMSRLSAVAYRCGFYPLIFFEYA